MQIVGFLRGYFNMNENENEKKDLYENFKELSEKEPLENYAIEFKDNNSPILIAAPHGGNIELGTSTIAKRIAFQYYNYYSFKGMKKADNKNLHITSIVFDEPVFIEAVKNAATVIAVHGCSGDSEFVMVGGRDKLLISRTVNNLYRLGFAVKKPQDAYSGQARDNLCNLGKNKAGLQIEISKKLRDRLIANEGKIMNKFCYAVRLSIRETYNFRYRFLMYLKRIFITRFISNRLD